MHFAETFKGGKGRRVFKVFMEGDEKFTVDIFEEVGAINTALVKTVENVEVKDGELTIEFKGITHPMAQEIGAIEIVKEE